MVMRLNNTSWDIYLLTSPSLCAPSMLRYIISSSPERQQKLCLCGTLRGPCRDIIMLTPMFPLSCAHVRAHTGCEMSAHRKTLSAHKFSFKNVSYKYFIHLVPNTDECE